MDPAMRKESEGSVIESEQGSRRILLSAYACEPDKGSEPAVGWNWAVQLARRGNDVWIITRENNRPSIEAALTRCDVASRMHFIYFDLPEVLLRLKKKRLLGVHAYYALWQRGAARLAAGVHAETGFDLVHHVTFVGFRQPSYMWRLGIPFIFGPVAGGERVPPLLRRHFSLREKLVEMARDAANFVARYNPNIIRSLEAAERVLVTSAQTRDLVPERFHAKTGVQLAIGLGEDEVSAWAPRERKPVDEGVLRFLFVGRFLEWKGMGLAIPAFARFAAQTPGASLTLVGNGPAGGRWRRLVQRLGIADRVRWIEWVPRDEMGGIYASHDVFLFPSLRDSGGMVVLEAMAHGLPVISLALGGPSVIVDDSCGVSVRTEGRTEPEVIDTLHDAMHAMAAPGRRNAWGAGGRHRVPRFLWTSLVSSIYGEIPEAA